MEIKVKRTQSSNVEVSISNNSTPSSRQLILPLTYINYLNLLETQRAIKTVKDSFEKQLAQHLCLIRVSAPLFVTAESGVNDNLSGSERPVAFDLLETGQEVQVVQSLAKWKRIALQRYNFPKYEGLYTDMNAIRRDEILDNIHSVYVDQWDWELIIDENDRNSQFLEKIVKQIVTALRDTENLVHEKHPDLKSSDKVFCDDIFFVTSQELEDLYPNLESYERENIICQKHKIVFIKNIGYQLKSGKAHDLRAPDYDDWNLNGDILVWYPPLNRAIEISSMGIRVNKGSLANQLQLSDNNDRKHLTYHKMLLRNELPQTIGGGIGQSRICMMMLKKAHIGEIQCSIWPKSMIDECAALNIHLI